MTRKLLGYGAWVALLGVGFQGINIVLGLSIEQAPIVCALSLGYLLVVGIGARLVWGYEDRQMRSRVRAEAMAAAREAGADPETGEPSVFTPEQWAHVAPALAGIDLSDLATRWRLEAELRSDPDALQETRSILRKIQSDEEAALSPQAKHWLWRVATGMVIGGVAVVMTQH